MKIIISGASGVGKTTLCERIVKKAREQGIKCGGVICPEVEGGERRRTAALDLSTGEKEETAVRNSSNDGISAEGNSDRNIIQVREGSNIYKIHVGNYTLNKRGILLGRRAIRRAIDNGSDIIFIDEIGPLERKDDGLMPEIKRAMALGKNLIIVIREKMLNGFINMFPETGFRIFIINQENRNQFADKIIEELNTANAA